MRTFKLFVLMLVMALIAAACGGDDGSDTTTAGDEAPATTEAGDEAPATTEAGEEAPATTAAPEMEMATVRVAIGNLRAIQYFPVYVADAAGFFEEEGIDAELEIVSGSGAVVQQLIAENIDIMLSNPAAAINAVANEQADIVTWCTTHYQNIFGLATPTETGITDVAGLEGKVIGISEPSGGEVPVVRAALATAGLVDGEDYELLAIGEGGQLTFEALSSGDAQAYSSSVFDVAAVEAQGLPLTQIMPEEFLYVPSIAYSSNRTYFDENSDILARFGRATAKAQAWASDPANRDEANALIEPYNPELFEDPEFVDAIWDATLRLLTPPAQMGVDPPYCAHYIPGWETYVEAALETPVEEGGLAGDIDIEAMANESLVPEINDFDPSSVELPSSG